MNSIAIAVSRLRRTSWSGWVERPLQFISLAKPRVMALSLFTAFVGLVIAPICPRNHSLASSQSLLLQPAPEPPAH
jgi:heme O synthase-like polyprenyltransferase